MEDEANSKVDEATAGTEPSVDEGLVAAAAETQETQEPGTSAPAVQPAPTGKISPELAKLAEEYGYDDAEIQSFGSEASLRKTLALIDARMIQVGNSQVGQREAVERETQPAPEPQPQKPTNGHRPPEDEIFLNDEDFGFVDEKLREKLNGVTASYRKQLAEQAQEIQKMSTALREVYGHYREQAENNFFGEFDGAIEALGPAFAALGKGATRSLNPESPEWQARNQVVNGMDVLKAGYLNRGQAVPPVKELAKRAAYAIFGTNAKAIARQELANQITHDRRSAVVPAGGRAPRSIPRGDKLAIQVAGEKLKELQGDE